MTKTLNFTALKKIFKHTKNPENEYYTSTVGYTDPNNHIMIIPKIAAVRDYILSHFEVTEQAIPSFTYKESNKPCKISVKYMSLILSIISIEDKNGFEILALKDYPLRIETSQMIVYIAPMVTDYD